MLPCCLSLFTLFSPSLCAVLLCLCLPPCVYLIFSRGGWREGSWILPESCLHLPEVGSLVSDCSFPALGAETSWHKIEKIHNWKDPFGVPNFCLAQGAILPKITKVHPGVIYTNNAPAPLLSFFPPSWVTMHNQKGFRRSEMPVENFTAGSAVRKRVTFCLSFSYSAGGKLRALYALCDVSPWPDLIG